MCFVAAHPAPIGEFRALQKKVERLEKALGVRVKPDPVLMLGKYGQAYTVSIYQSVVCFGEPMSRTELCRAPGASTLSIFSDPFFEIDILKIAAFPVQCLLSVLLENS